MCIMKEQDFTPVLVMPAIPVVPVMTPPIMTNSEIRENIIACVGLHHRGSTQHEIVRFIYSNCPLANGNMNRRVHLIIQEGVRVFKLYVSRRRGTTRYRLATHREKKELKREKRRAKCIHRQLSHQVVTPPRRSTPTPVENMEEGVEFNLSLFNVSI